SFHLRADERSHEQAHPEHYRNLSWFHGNSLRRNFSSVLCNRGWGQNVTYPAVVIMAKRFCGLSRLRTMTVYSETQRGSDRMSLHTLNDILPAVCKKPRERVMLQRSALGWVPISSTEIYRNIVGVAR